MKALVRYGNSADEMEIRDVEVPIPSDTQALIRVKAVGVCGVIMSMSDEHIFCNNITRGPHVSWRNRNTGTDHDWT